MARRALPALLVAAASLADSAGDHRVALYVLLAAVPALAATTLAAFGEHLDGGADASRQLQGILSALALLLVVAGATVRAPAVLDGALPPLAAPTLIACLCVLALEAAVGAARVSVERPDRRRPEVAPDELREAA